MTLFVSKVHEQEHGRRFRSGRLAAIGGAAGLLIASMAVGVSGANAATSDPTTPDGVASLIHRVAPAQGSIVKNHSIPVDPDSPISVPSDGSRGDNDLTVNLPSNLSLSPGTTASDGTVVYPSRTTGGSAAVQALSNGAVRVQTVIDSATAPKEFSYSFGSNFRPAQAADGSIYVVGFTPDGQYTAYSVAAAWARDANGNAVDTHYEIRGNDLVQIVQPSADAAYPIVADPTWQWYNAAYGAGFSKKETRTFASAGSIAGFCGLLPGPLAVACGVVGADWWAQAGLAANAKGCVFIAAVPAPIAMRWISPECK